MMPSIVHGNYTCVNISAVDGNGSFSFLNRGLSCGVKDGGSNVNEKRE